MSNHFRRVGHISNSKELSFEFMISYTYYLYYQTLKAAQEEKEGLLQEQ